MATQARCATQTDGVEPGEVAHVTPPLAYSRTAHPIADRGTDRDRRADAGDGTSTNGLVASLERRDGRRKVYTVAGIAGILLLLAVVRTCSTRHKAAAPPPPRSVAVVKVITKDVPLYLDEIGTCTAAETVQVQPQVSGQIISREFEDGADVKKGDVLFRIDPRPFEAVLSSAQADAVLAHATLARQTQLRSKAVVAGQDYDT